MSRVSNFPGAVSTFIDTAAAVVLLVVVLAVGGVQPLKAFPVGHLTRFQNQMVVIVHQYIVKDPIPTDFFRFDEQPQETVFVGDVFINVVSVVAALYDVIEGSFRYSSWLSSHASDRWNATSRRDGSAPCPQTQEKADRLKAVPGHAVSDVTTPPSLMVLCPSAQSCLRGVLR